MDFVRFWDDFYPFHGSGSADNLYETIKKYEEIKTILSIDPNRPYNITK